MISSNSTGATACTLQMGGSDQWGNIVTGIDLGRRMGTPQLYRPDLAAADHRLGRQNGQDGAGRGLAQRRHAVALRLLAILAQQRRTPTSRASCKLFTDLPLDEIARLARLQGAEINEAKKILATEATALVHGREAAEQAAETARQTFEEGALAASLPNVAVARQEIDGGLGVLSAFVKAGLVASTGEARRQIKGGGLQSQRRDGHRRARDCCAPGTSSTARSNSRSARRSMCC